MTTSTDERRARAILGISVCEYGRCVKLPCLCMDGIARTISESDEAAGMVLVPREATERMQDAGWIDKEDVSPAEIWRAMIAAATEADNG